MTASSMLLTVRLVLVALFLVAGCAKLGRRAETKAAALELGAPGRLASIAGPVLPLAELALAVTLAVGHTARFAAGAALLLAAGFGAVNGRALLRGRRPACRCFGDLLPTGAGAGMLVLDLAMAASAATIVARGPGAPIPVRGSGAVELLLGAVLSASAPLLAARRTASLELRRRFDVLESRLRTLEAAARLGADGASPVGGPPAGSPAPVLHVADLDGREQRLEPRAQTDLLLLFLEPGCEPCERILADAAAWQSASARHLTFWFVYGESLEQAVQAARRHGIEHVYTQPDRRASEAYRIPGTPSGVLIERGGLVGVPLVAGYAAVHDLVARYLPAAQQPRARAAVGALE